MHKVFGVVGFLLVVTGAMLSWSVDSRAARYTSPNYTIDASIDNSFGGSTSGGSYQLVSSGGESIIGEGAGGSYILDQGYVAQLDQGLQLTVQPKGLAAYYAFDENESEAVYDLSKNNNNGSSSGTSRSTGVRGDALEFPLEAGSVSVPDSSSLDIADNLTISLWAKVDAYHTMYARHLVSKWSGTTDANFAFYLFGEYQGNNAGGRVGLYATRGGAWGAISAQYTKMLPGQWYHIAVSYDSSIGGQLYINGDAHGSRTGSGLLSVNSHPLAMTSSGHLDELKIYSRSLSPAEIKAEYQAGLAGSSAGLAFSDQLIAGSSQTVSAEAVVQTDAAGYSLALSQNGNLTSGSNSIPAVSGTINSPISWSEGSTKGLGFTLVSTTATAIPGKWSSGNSYAGIPSTGTSFYSRTGYSGGGKDTIELRYRLDVATAQVSGDYTNQVTYTGVMTP